MEIFECKIEVYDRQLDELGVTPQEEFWVKACFKKDEICSIREIYDEPNKCTVYLRSYESFVVNMPYNETFNRIFER